MTWDELEKTCGECAACALHETRTNCVFGVGNRDARLMFVGEAPGEKEDLSGIPFVGAAGQLLDKYLAAVGIERDDVYIANILNGALCALLITVIAWLEKKRFPHSVEALMAIPDSFGVSGDRRMDITVRSMEQVVRISKTIEDFCLQKNIDSTRSYYVALCTEEMAGNIIAHGFTKDKRKHSVDIRLTCMEDEIIVRIRDDCMAFNPAEHAQIINPKSREERFKDMGIRMVYSIAKEVNYQNLLDQNVLTIHL